MRFSARERKLQDEIKALRGKVERLLKRVTQLNNENWSYKRELDRVKLELTRAEDLLKILPNQLNLDFHIISTQPIPCPVCNQENKIYLGMRGQVVGPVVLSYDEMEAKKEMLDIWDLKMIHKYKAFPNKLPEDL